MLEIDIQHVEAGGAGDAGDLDAAHQAHRHRGDDLAARELLFHAVAQYVRGGASHAVTPVVLA